MNRSRLGTGEQASATPRTRFGVWIPLVIWAAARLISALFVIVAAAAQPDLTHDPGWHVEGVMPASPSCWQVLANWDGQWYKTIALHGYPSVVPTGEHSQNVFAFYPVYPMTVGVLMRLTGLSFEVVAACLSLAAGGLAAVLLFNWLARTRGRSVAAAGIAVLGTFPSAPALQAAYSDAVAMVLLVVCLRAAVERRWPLLLTFGAMLSLTRPVVLPLAVFVLATELRRAYLGHDRDGRLDKKAVFVVACLSALSFAWPTTVWVRTGDAGAYFDSAASWVRAGGLAGGWLRGMWDMGLKIHAVLSVIILLALLALRWRSRDEPRAPDGLGTWAGLYMLFILLTTTINTSILRYALLTLVPLGTFGPLALTPVTPRRRGVLLGVVVVCQLGLQWWWVRNVLVVDDSPSVSWPP